MSIQIRDVVQPPAAWYAWVNSPERAIAMRGQLAAADAAAGDTSIVRAPDGFVRTLSIRDVGAPLTEEDDTADVLDLRDPHAALIGRWAAKDGLLDHERAALAAAADGGAGEVLDLSNAGASR